LTNMSATDIIMSSNDMSSDDIKLLDI